MEGRGVQESFSFLYPLPLQGAEGVQERTLPLLGFGVYFSKIKADVKWDDEDSHEIQEMLKNNEHDNDNDYYEEILKERKS